MELPPSSGPIKKSKTFATKGFYFILENLKPCFQSSGFLLARMLSFWTRGDETGILLIQLTEKLHRNLEFQNQEIPNIAGFYHFELRILVSRCHLLIVEDK